jgi:hypothetical protein
MDCCNVFSLFRARSAVNEQLTLVQNSFEDEPPPREPSAFEKVEDWWENLTTKKKRQQKEETVKKSRENRERLRSKYNYKKKEESGCKTQ